MRGGGGGAGGGGRGGGLLRPHGLLALLQLLLLLGLTARAIEIKWTPADGEGPAPASKRYRDAMAAQQQQQGQGQGQGPREMSEQEQLRMMQQMLQQGGGGAPQQQGGPSFLERLLLAGYMAVGGTIGLAQRHPKAAATLSLTAVTGLGLRRAARTNGLLLTRRPHYWSVFEPPVEFLSKMLEEELPAAIEKQQEQEQEGTKSETTAFRGSVAALEEASADGRTLRRRVAVGEGEGAYRRAASLVRTLSLLDAVAAGAPSLGRLYCSERMREGLFLRPRGGGGGVGGWSIAPVAIERGSGRLAVGGEAGGSGSKTTKKTKKAKAKAKAKGKAAVEETYEQVVLRALPGCPWGRGAELRLVASWRDPAHGGDDAVTIEVAWFTPSTHPPGGLVPPKAAFLERVAAKAAALVEQEMAILRVRERQQQQLAADALKAEAERRRKARELLLNPPPDKKKWKKQQGMAAGGQQGPARWQPSSDLQARRNPRRGG